MYLVFIKNNNEIIIAIRSAFVKGFQGLFAEKANAKINIVHTSCKSACNVVKYSKCVNMRKNFGKVGHLLTNAPY